MHLLRRGFLQLGALASVLLVTQTLGCAPSHGSEHPPLRILILGGTGFLGPKTVEVALARGHHVTIFNRGKREKYLPFNFEGVEHLYGNRDPKLPADDAKGPDGALLHPDASPKGLEQLEGKAWDVVIDNSGYYPRHVGASAELLARSCKQYIYISSISAYADNSVVDANEDAKLAELADPTVETMGEGYVNYGGLKVLCERAAQAAFPGRCAVVRPGYIVGPGDPTDRFTYWPVRIARGGDVVAPGKPEDPLQWIDVRDLADFLVTLAEHGTSGVFNACGPSKPGRFGDVIDACAKRAKQPCTVSWIPADFLEKEGLGGEDGAFPIWNAPAGAYAGSHTWSNDRAEAAGLRFRPLAETIDGILEWWPKEVERRRTVTAQLAEEAKKNGQPPPRAQDPEAWRAGPQPPTEAEILAKWKAAGAK
jgi:2'-hydroxyisoflavone reductase